jgi:predicted enzyme related to lactoylglutathione lyase
MKKVTGIGGIFFKSKDPKLLNEWYRENLGLNTNEYGTVFEWHPLDEPEKKATTVWNPFKQDTKYFSPSEKDFMFNFRVADLEGLLKELEQAGVEQVGELQVFDYGKFAHIMDPEGNKIELWEAVDEGFENSDSNTSTN